MTKKYISIGLFFVLIFAALQSKSDYNLLNIFNKRGVQVIENTTYQEECGACHFDYQPGLLPERSWKKLMTNDELLNHFGEDVSFDDSSTANKIIKYLTLNAADKSSYNRSKKISRSLSSHQSPLRITNTPYIKRKHHGISKELITQQSVGSLSNCTACHNNAHKGDYDDDSVTIPNIKAGLISIELNTQKDGYVGIVKPTNESFKIISTKISSNLSVKKLCRVVSFKGNNEFSVRTYCKIKGGFWH